MFEMFVYIVGVESKCNIYIDKSEKGEILLYHMSIH